jgi:hypothetical protein
MYNNGSGLMTAETAQLNKMSLREASEICGESMGKLRRWSQEKRITFVKCLPPTSSNGKRVYTVNSREFFDWWNTTGGQVDQGEPEPAPQILTDVELAILRQILEKLAGL